MGRWTRGVLVGALAVTGILGTMPPAHAKGTEESSPYGHGMMRKLGRGIANIATCPAELIRTPELVTHKEGTLAGLTVGVMQGVWRTLLRGLTGVYEVVTFYAEIPDGFEPLIKPEFVWARGDWQE